MSKLGTPLTTDYLDSGFDKFLSRPFEGLGEASREWQSTMDEHAEDSSLHAKAFTTTIAFTSTDYRTVTWAAGKISYQDGLVTPEIATSNTGVMSARTYIYYDPQASKVALQTTTTAATATQGERILLAIAVPNSNTSGKAEIQAFGATGTYVANLSAEHITSGSIRSKTVTLAVDAGEGDSYFNAGKTDFVNTDSGFILGLDDSDSDKAKFYIGDSSKFLNWDGSDLIVQGLIKNGSGTTLIDANGLISTVNFASDTATKTANQTITGTTVADITGLTLTFTASSTRTTKVLFMSTITGYHDDADGLLSFYFDLDGADIGPRFVVGQTAWAQSSQTASAQFVYSVTSGEHTIKMQSRGNNAAPSAGVVESAFLNATLTYVVLGA